VTAQLNCQNFLLALMVFIHPIKLHPFPPGTIALCGHQPEILPGVVLQVPEGSSSERIHFSGNGIDKFFGDRVYLSLFISLIS